MSQPVCRILVDRRELPSGICAELAHLGIATRVESLEVGDYALGEGVVVERKTVRGLHLAVAEGRFWHQIGRLRARAAFPFLLVEGGSLDEGPLGRQAVRAICVSVVAQGIPILFARDIADTAIWLRSVGARFERGASARDRPRYAQQRKAQEARVAEAMLAAVPGISVRRARALLSRFGSLSAVLTAGPEEWRRTHGIGPAIARELERAIA